MISDEQIKYLIECPKRIIEAPKSCASSRGSTKKEFTMTSQDGVHSFKGFLTQNEKFSENFSLGLVYEDKETKDRFCLIRCNGPHGGVKNIPHHFFSHIHTVLAEDVNNGIKIERHIEQTRDYSTYEDAIQFYVNKINLSQSDRVRHFPKPKDLYTQQDLFQEDHPF